MQVYLTLSSSTCKISKIWNNRKLKRLRKQRKKSAGNSKESYMARRRFELWKSHKYRTWRRLCDSGLSNVWSGPLFVVISNRSICSNSNLSTSFRLSAMSSDQKVDPFKAKVLITTNLSSSILTQIQFKFFAEQAPLQLPKSIQSLIRGST